MDNKPTRPANRRRPSKRVRLAVAAHMAAFDSAIAALRQWVESKEVR